MSEEHATTENECRWVCLVLALDIETDVSASWLENGHITTHVATWHDTRSTDQTCTNVGENTTVQVGHNHDIELLRSADTLHAGIVDNHVVGLDGGILLTDLLDGVSE